jgi:hypothetical protein
MERQSLADLQKEIKFFCNEEKQFVKVKNLCFVLKIISAG